MSSSKKEPEKMKLNSQNISVVNRVKLKQLFPSVFTEAKDEGGEVVESIDFEKLKAELGEFSDLFEGRREHYGMDWPGKKDCMKIIQQPSVGTLKPSKDESVDFDTTENLFIEGDNLEVLKLLQKSYYGKIKMIYIDPPYNTGKEFIYPDKFSESLDTYLAYAGLIDDEGKKFSSNTPNEGRFHTKWLNMMYPRLYLARNLLREDGIIFISIGDDELVNLCKICDEIFGEDNCIGRITWKARVKPVNIGDAKYRPQKEVEYVLIYQKNYVAGVFQPLITGGARTYPHEINGRKYRLATILKSNRGSNYRSTMVFELEGYTPQEGQRWQAGKDVIRQLFNDNYIEFKGGIPFRRYYEDEEGSEHDPFYCFMEVDWSSTSEAGKNQLNELVGNQHGFDTVKPTRLIQTFIQACTEITGNDIVLDFFAGSSTTAQSVFEQNEEDNGNRMFILVQLPEHCDSKSKFDYVTDIGKERICQVINKIKDEREENKSDPQIKLPNKEEDQPQLDLGFKVFKLDKSNFKKWDGTDPGIDLEKLEEQLSMHVNHIDINAKQEDILYELLLKAGFKLTEKIEKLEMAGRIVFSIANGGLMICLEDEITSELINKVAEKTPSQFICLDHGFRENDQLKTNAMQTFAARNQSQDKGKEIVFRTV
jgi:adenine-specific DNA-methyltransferase